MNSALMTPRENVVLQAIIAYQRKHRGMSPTYDDIAEAVGCARPTAFEFVKNLRRKGVVSTIKGQPRSIVVLSGCRSCAALSAELLALEDEIEDLRKKLTAKDSADG